MASNTGSTISRKLRTMGWNISPYGRRYRHEGIFVSGRNELATIIIDLGVATKNQQVCQSMAEELVGLPWLAEMTTKHPTEAGGAAFIHLRYVKA